MATENERKTVYRDSIDGTFITKEKAERRLSTTEKQRVRVRPRTRKPSTPTSRKGEAR